MPTRNKRREERFVDRIKEGARSAVEKAHDQWDTVKDEARDQIKEKPFSSVAIAAGIGALVGAGVALGINALVSHRRRTFVDRLSDWF